MQGLTVEKPALLIIDMVKDNFDETRNLPVTPHAKAMIQPLNTLIRAFRQKGYPVVFSTDAFTPSDFFFTGRMKPHSLKGSQGAEIFEELDRHPDDYWQQKPSMSAFFKTGLEDWLRRRGVTMCALAGIATQFCVLATALDAVCHDFKVALLSDCTATGSSEIQNAIIRIYQKNPLYPLFRVIDSAELMQELGQKQFPSVS
jgi:nicotinamidase-related amidase